VYLRLYEVGPRDGLQILSYEVPLQKREQLIRMLSWSGLKNIEVGSCVSSSVLPMRDSEKLSTNKKAHYSMLVLSEGGFSRATSSGFENININLSMNPSFNLKNLNKNYDDVLKMYLKMLDGYDRNRVRAYISHAFDRNMSDKDIDGLIMDVSKVSNTIVLCDTDGDADIEVFRERINKFIKPNFSIALHLHKGNGNYMEKVQIAYELGVCEFDTSIATFGGCINANNPTANISTIEMIKWAESKYIPLEGKLNLDILQEAQDFALLLAETTASGLRA